MNKIIQGNCLEKLKELEENSVDAIITDPPYELGFMGKAWDNTGIAYNVDLWKEALRVLKPGGHLLSFSGTRTYHRMASAIEDAGFEVRDMIEWVYGSGFPKSLNIGKAVDKLQGNEREVVGDNPNFRPVSGKEGYLGQSNFRQTDGMSVSTKGTSEWEGWGTALKPAHEPICMARKPLAEKNVALNVLKWGTGGINIDESRVGMSQEDIEMLESKSSKEFVGVKPFGNTEIKGSALKPNKIGRFPANLLHDNSEEVRECFPDTKSSSRPNCDGKMYSSNTYGNGRCNMGSAPNDSGNASRFFKSIIYQAKASKSERNKGCEELEEKDSMKWSGGNEMKGLAGTYPDGTPRPKQIQQNNHPTVKPIALMEYLIKMITPKGGTVLDPFAGSGSTLVAAKQNGFNYIGIEREEEYIKIIEARLK